MSSTLERSLIDLAILAEPVRRRLYLHVVAQGDPVSRDGAAAATGIGRSLAAFHLDRLVEAGLLEAVYRRLGERTGPGAGRTSKLYRASARELAASVPARHYDVAADLFAAALDELPAGAAVLDRLAHARGRTLGAEAKRRAGPRARASRRQAEVLVTLSEAGYVPFQAGDEVRLRSCPFDAVARRHRDVTCGMNLALVQGVLAGAGLVEADARQEFRPGQCCVALRGHRAVPANPTSIRNPS